MIAYTDLDWGSDIENRRSTSGFVTTLGSAPISWESKKQSTVALSSCEVEYIALAEATREIINFRALCVAMEIKQQKPTTLFCDNQGAISQTREISNQHQRTKHIDIKFRNIENQLAIILEGLDKESKKMITGTICKVGLINFVIC